MCWKNFNLDIARHQEIQITYKENINYPYLLTMFTIKVKKWRDIVLSPFELNINEKLQYVLILNDKCCKTYERYIPSSKEINNRRAGSGEPRISAKLPIQPTPTIFSSSIKTKRVHYCQHYNVTHFPFSPCFSSDTFRRVMICPFFFSQILVFGVGCQKSEILHK